MVISTAMRTYCVSLRGWVGGLSFSALAMASHAASIVMVGAAIGLTGASNDEIDQWRTNTVLKTYDADNNNVYGSAGYVLYATDTLVNGNAGAVVPADPLSYTNGTRATLISVPAYLTLTNNGQTQIAASYGYKAMDDPTQPVGPLVTDVESG